MLKAKVFFNNLSELPFLEKELLKKAVKKDDYDYHFAIEIIFLLLLIFFSLIQGFRIYPLSDRVFINTMGIVFSYLLMPFFMITLILFFVRMIYFIYKLRKYGQNLGSDQLSSGLWKWIKIIGRSLWAIVFIVIIFGLMMDIGVNGNYSILSLFFNLLPLTFFCGTIYLFRKYIIKERKIKWFKLLIAALVIVKLSSLVSDWSLGIARKFDQEDSLPNAWLNSVSDLSGQKTWSEEWVKKSSSLWVPQYYYYRALNEHVTMVNKVFIAKDEKKALRIQSALVQEVEKIGRFSFKRSVNPAHHLFPQYDEVYLIVNSGRTNCFKSGGEVIVRLENTIVSFYYSDSIQHSETLAKLEEWLDYIFTELKQSV